MQNVCVCVVCRVSCASARCNQRCKNCLHLQTNLIASMSVVREDLSPLRGVVEAGRASRARAARTARRASSWARNVTLLRGAR